MQYEYISDGVLKSARFSVVTCRVGGGQVFLDTAGRSMDETPVLFLHLFLCLVVKWFLGVR